MVRRAFSLIELLIVVAIVGVLVAMVLPAVQQAREAASFAQCRGNLKQVGLALHVYVDVYGAVPTRQLRWQDPDDGLWNYLNVFGQLRAYLEENDTRSLAEQFAEPQAMSVYLCPSRRTTSVGMKCDYAIPDDYLNFSFRYTTSNLLWDSLAGSGGAVPPGAEIDHHTIAKVSDGTSNTLLFGHKGLDTQYYKKPIDAMPSWITPWNFLSGYFGTKRYYDQGWLLRTNTLAFGVDTNADQSRFHYAFVRDKNDQGYNVGQLSWDGDIYSSMMYVGYLTNVPAFELFSSPHATLPCVLLDGSVRSFAYSKKATVDVSDLGSPPSQITLSPEAQVLENLWRINDGNTVDLAD